MEKEQLKKLNIRVLILLLFFTIVFLAACGFMLATMLVENLAPSTGVFAWSVIGLVLTFLTLVYWYFKTKKLLPLELKRRRVVFYSLLVFVSTYVFFGSYIFSQMDIVFGSIVMIAFLIYFIRKNTLEGYSTRMLMLLSLGMGIITAHMTSIFIYKFITTQESWGIVSFINSFLGSLPNLISKFPPLILSLVFFSAIISFVPGNDARKNEVLDS